MHDYLNGDIDSGRGAVSREDPMLFGIPRRVVPALIVCDSSVRNAQMTRYLLEKEQEMTSLKAKTLAIVKDDFVEDVSNILCVCRPTNSHCLRKQHIILTLCGFVCVNSKDLKVTHHSINCSNKTTHFQKTMFVQKVQI